MKLTFALDDTNNIKIILSDLNKSLTSALSVKNDLSLGGLYIHYYVDSNTAFVHSDYVHGGLVNESKFSDFCDCLLAENYVSEEECKSVKGEYAEFIGGVSAILNTLEARLKELTDFYGNLSSSLSYSNLEKTCEIISFKKNSYTEFYTDYGDLEKIIENNISSGSKEILYKDVKITSSLERVHEYLRYISELFKNFSDIKTKSSQFIATKKEDRLKWVADNLEPCLDADPIKKLLLDKKHSIISLRLPLGHSNQTFEVASDGLKSAILSIKLVASDISCLSKDENDSFCSSRRYAVFELKIAGQNNKRFFSLSDKADIDFRLLTNLFASYPQIKTEEAASYIKPSPLVEGFFSEGLSGYDQQITQDYAILHQAIAKELETIVKNHKRALQIYVVGCGIGDEFYFLLEVLDGKKYEIVGIDIDKSNIKIARENFSGIPHVSFIVADLAQLKLDAPKKGFSLFKTPPPLCIVIGSGSITRKVQADTQTAFSNFRNFAQPADFVILTGENSNAIFRRDAKRMGFEINQQHIPLGDGFSRIMSTYTKTPIQLDKAIKYFIKQGSINLQEHIDPISVLKTILKPNNIKKFHTINLQDALLSAEDVGKLLQVLKRGKFTIVITGKESWYTDNLAAFKEHHINITTESLTYNELKFTDENGRVTTLIERPKISTSARQRAEMAVQEIMKKTMGPEL